MHRADILAKAAYMTTTDRDKDYGDPLANHTRIAQLWSVVLGVEVTPVQVALCMNQVKVARLIVSPDHTDSNVDGAAYMAIAGEIA